MKEDWLKYASITPESLLESAKRILQKEDGDARSKAQLRARRSRQEALQFRMLFEDTYDAYRVRLLDHYGAGIDRPEFHPAFALREVPGDNRYALLMVAVLIPYAMTKAIEERSGVPAKSEDIARCCHFLAGTADAMDTRIAQHALRALITLSLVQVALGKGGQVSAILLRDIMDDGNGRIDPSQLDEIAAGAQGSRQAFYADLFHYWHVKNGLNPPSPIQEGN